MTRRCILHIGNHKTGSTSIQSALASANDPRLFNEPYSDADRERLKSWFGNSWIDKRHAGDDVSAVARPELARRLREHNPDGDVIFSAEDFSWIFDGEGLKEFADELREGFDSFKIIAYLRRQDRNAVSLYQQGMKSSRSRIARFMGVQAVSLPEHQPHFDLYFDYNRRLGAWADAFGDEAMNFHIFADVIDECEIVKHFSEVAEIKLGRTDLHLRKSMSKPTQLLKQRVLELGLDIDFPDMFLKLLEDDRKALPPRARAEEFYAHYQKSNQALNERFGVNDRQFLFDDDFSGYTVEGTENWDSESADSIVTTLIFMLAEAKGQNEEREKRVRKLRRRLRRLEA